MQNTPSLDAATTANDPAHEGWEGIAMRYCDLLVNVVDTLNELGQTNGAKAIAGLMLPITCDAIALKEAEEVDQDVEAAEEIDPHREASRLIFGDASYASQPLMAHQLDDVFYAGPEHGDISVNALAAKIAAYRAVTTPDAN